MKNLFFSPSHQAFALVFLSLVLFSCSSRSKLASTGIVRMTTHFYNTEGNLTFTHHFKVWYKDSVAIEEITGVNTVTDTANITTVTYPIIMYRYIDLRGKALYDYKYFSDTAKIIVQTVLPDSILTGGGWNFYSEKAPKIKGTPEPLSDTVIDNITYKRAKFIFSWHDSKKSFLIGCFICDGRGDMFSLEKAYSRKINCTMVKYFDYKVGKTKPFASIEVNFIADTLTNEELKVFEAWGRNAKQNPVIR